MYPTSSFKAVIRTFWETPCVSTKNGSFIDRNLRILRWSAKSRSSKVCDVNSARARVCVWSLVSLAYREAYGVEGLYMFDTARC